MRKGVVRRPDGSAMSEFMERTLVDLAGEEIGTVDDVIGDPFDLQPEWLVVKLGRFAGEHLVPVAVVEEQGDRLVARTDKEHVKSSPKVKQHTAPMGSERDAVYRHYGIAS